MAPSRSKPHGKSDAKRFHRRPTPKSGAAGLWLYGLHAVKAALANPARAAHRAVLTERAAAEIGAKLLARVPHEIADPDAVAGLLPAGCRASGRGAALRAPAPSAISPMCWSPAERRRIVLVLDQISDPHNVGAILRSAAAFGVSAVIVQDRHAPPESGVLAKAASGALDIVPYLAVVNIARALDELAELGFWRVALAGDGQQSLKEAVQRRRCRHRAGLGGRGRCAGWCASVAM